MFSRLCLVDEYRDWSQMAERSPGLSLTNDYNGLYAEYLFRAKGSAKDRVVYRTPGEIRSVRLAGWFAAQPVDFIVEGSEDGKVFRGLTLARRQRSFGKPPVGVAKDQSRTLVEYEGKVQERCRYLRVLWRGPAEVDRIEIEHSEHPQ